MTKATKSTTQLEIVITRTFDAPRKLVFEAWIKPERMARWWGPKEFTNPVCEMDVKPGGAWRIHMRSPEDTEYPLKGVYRDVIVPERIVCTMNWEEHPAEWQELLRKNGDDQSSHESLLTVTFDEREGKTEVEIRTLFATVAVREAMKKSGMVEGWTESLMRLEHLLAN